MRMLASLSLTFALVTAPSGAGAVIIRHDTPDAAYRASEADYPGLFALYRTRAGHRDCIATLIHERFAVTAAHCTRDRSMVEAIGDGKPGYAVEISGVANRVTEVIAHPDTAEGRTVDIALLRLAEPVSHLRLTTLYRAADEVGRIVLMPGWGGTGNGETGANQEDGLFRMAENRVDTATDRHLTWVFDAPSSDGVLPLEGISGPGDSGGPALIRSGDGFAILGVGSGQRTGGRPEGSYGVTEYFVRVSLFADWIDARIAERA